MKRDHDSLEARARRRIGRKLGFYIHAFSSLAIRAGTSGP